MAETDRTQQFDAVKLSHLVDAEYGNQGIDFKMVPREGFGWMNGQMSFVLRDCNAYICLIAAYQVGLSFMTIHMRRAVAACTSPAVFFSGGNRVDPTEAPIINPITLAMDNLDLFHSS